jgi:hypothetical protein
MRTVELTTVDLATKNGRLKWLEYRNNPEWKLIADNIYGTEAIFERIPERISNCCSAKIIETDVCSKCNEHCKIIEL